jgi:hypothetical protein
MKMTVTNGRQHINDLVAIPMGHGWVLHGDLSTKRAGVFAILRGETDIEIILESTDETLHEDEGLQHATTIKLTDISEPMICLVELSRYSLHASLIPISLIRNAWDGNPTPEGVIRWSGKEQSGISG